jgi:hypothetical protein
MPRKNRTPHTSMSQATKNNLVKRMRKQLQELQAILHNSDEESKRLRAMLAPNRAKLSIPLTPFWNQKPCWRGRLA